MQRGGQCGSFLTCMFPNKLEYSLWMTQWGIQAGGAQGAGEPTRPRCNIFVLFRLRDLYHYGSFFILFVRGWDCPPPPADWSGSPTPCGSVIGRGTVVECARRDGLH